MSLDEKEFIFITIAGTSKPLLIPTETIKALGFGEMGLSGGWEGETPEIEFEVIHSVAIEEFKENFSLKSSELYAKLTDTQNKATQYLRLCQRREEIINEQKNTIKELEATIKTLTNMKVEVNK